MGMGGEWLTTRRLAGIAALSYVVGASMESMEILGSPTLSSSADEIREAYADRALSLVTWVGGALSLLAYGAFAVLSWSWLRKQDGSDRWRTLILVGGVGGPIIAAAGLAAVAPLVLGAGVGDGTVGTLSDLRLLSRILSGPLVAMFLAGFGLATLASERLPRPLPRLALAIALPLAIAPVAAIVQEEALEIAVGLAFAAQALWVFCAGIWMTLANGITRLAFVRRSAFLILVIAAGLIGIALVAVPGATGEFFAWSLAPEPLAAFCGGAYIGAAAAYAAAVPRPAGQVRGMVAGAIVLSLSVLVITLTHADQFDFDRLQAVVWLILFCAFPLVMLGLFIFEREDEEPGQRLPAWARTVLGAVAALAAALALALWIDPTALSGPSPFELPPLGGRFAGSWVATLSVVCGWAAIRDRADEARLSALLLITLPAGVLVAALRTIDQLEPAGAAAVYLTVLVLLVLCGAVVASRLQTSDQPARQA